MRQGTSLKRYFIVFVCFILTFSLSRSVIVIAENSTINEGSKEENTSQQTEVKQTTETTETTSELMEEVTTLGISISIAGSYFNESVVVSGEVTNFSEGEVVALTVFRGGDIHLVEDLLVEESVWQHQLDISNLLFEGHYSLKATIGDTDSNFVDFSVDRTPPEIFLTNPLNYYINEAMIEGTIVEENFSGGVFFLYSKEREELKKTEQITSTSLFIPIEEIDEGEYYFTVEATDLAGNSAKISGEFLYDRTRPFISPASLFPAPNMTQVPFISDSGATLTISAKIVDHHRLLEGYVENIENAIKVYEKGVEFPIDGTVTFENDESGNAIVTFIPSNQNVWKPNQKYYVFMNPFLTDNAGNLVHPRNWSFTTETATGVESPHGNYLNNTNTCKTCHNVHAAPKPRLEGTNFEMITGPEEEIDQVKRNLEQNDQDKVNGYCMACHDGTVASPMNDHFAEGVKSDHNKTLVNTDGAVVSQSCGNCHNVHLASDSKNSNRLKDRLTFHHDGVEDVGFVDSAVQLCESCHETDSLNRRLDFDKGVIYEVFPYRSWNTSMEDGKTFGSSEDYLLCLRCHNETFSEQYGESMDIERFYKDATSGHFITMNEDRDHLSDGSFLNGQIPCADCHDTHSSANDRLIKNELGHNWPGILENWERADERTFCLTCHNNSTELYGITVSLNKAVAGHRAGDIDSCAACHGGASQSFLETAHAPKRIRGLAP